VAPAIEVSSGTVRGSVTGVTKRDKVRQLVTAAVGDGHGVMDGEPVVAAADGAGVPIPL